MKISIKQQRTEEVRQLEQRWTRDLIAPGWTALPSVILERQQALGLDATDICIVLHLARFWWYRDNPPHPSRITIATCMGIDVSTVRRRIARMEKDGLIERVARFDRKNGRQQTNLYKFDGLINEVAPYAQEALQNKEKRKAEAVDRIRRKKPRLVVSDGSAVEAGKE